MNPAINIELQFFLVSILWGGILLIAYDILRIIRRLIKHDSFIIALEDLIFWVLASLFIFAMIYHENNGVIRGFSIIGILLGAILYHYTISDFTVNIIAKLVGILLSPITMALYQVKRFLLFVLRNLRKFLKNLLYQLKIHIKSVRILLKKRKRETEKKTVKPKRKKKRR